MPFVGIFIAKNFRLVILLRSKKELNKKQIIKEHMCALFWDLPGLNIRR